jgi:hypothetical protein
MTEVPIFDVRKSVTRRNIERVIILPFVAICFIFFGLKLIPDTFIWELSVDAIGSWSGWAFVGLILIGTGIVNLIKTVIFAFRARGMAGEWHFRLTQDELLWQVPDHAHGPEIGFKTPLSNIKELEFRTISKHEELNEREYWIHFPDQNPIQLQSYTGISVSWLVSKIHEAGVPYTKTFVEK